MVEINLIKSIWRCNSEIQFFKYKKIIINCLVIIIRKQFLERDLFPALGTFLACLYLGVELGILVGVVIDFMILAYFNAKPLVEIKNKQVCNVLHFYQTKKF